jgi:hypothetical protein
MMLIENSVVTRQPFNEFGIHLPNMIHVLEVSPNVLERLLHNTRIGEGNHTILERGHINISTSKQLICPPTGIMEGQVWQALFQALRVSSYQGISVKRQHLHITLNSYLRMHLKLRLDGNVINSLAGRSHVEEEEVLVEGKL